MFPFARMSVLTVAVVAAAILTFASEASSCEQHGRDLGAAASTPDIPFYLKLDSDGNTYAVIYYGEMGDVSKEMHIQCFADALVTTAKETGPGSTSCICPVDTNECTLQVPFVFERDSSGAIVSVSYHSNDNKVNEELLVVNFRPLKDASGVTVGAIFDDEAKTPILVVPYDSKADANGNIIAVYVDVNDDKKAHGGSATCLAIWILGLLCFAILMITLACHTSLATKKRTTEPESAMKDAEDEGTEVGSTVDEA